ncbi:cell division protein FtsQ [Albimonas donghaensis]|uniref:Cell division protein FtsQ n=1 Tax=Albimonas donghaensis TaxID=356660 RepID=A0A1H3ELD2_9RHOB|nr:cell division protein FtsQ/DivIB [Albimonas donghaensis]SDX78764.1 cell division protein FtsQ [Albimonas donghaensis]
MIAPVRAAQRLTRRLRPAPPAPFETPRRRRDPSPSRLRYRLDRLGRRGYVRFALRRLAPPAALMLMALGAWQSATLREAVHERVESLRASLMDRPEFAVSRLEIVGGAPELQARVSNRLGLSFPVSSLRLDLPALKTEIETMPGVARAVPKVMPDGALRIGLVQRAPEALWRWDGQLHLVDADGVLISPVAHRADRADLPLILGEGADRAVAEALVLWKRAEPIHDRLRGLIRMGERRWSLALGGDVLVHLPAENPEAALQRLLALDAADDLLDREISVIDFRDPQRPVLRLTARAVAELERAKALIKGKDA